MHAWGVIGKGLSLGRTVASSFRFRVKRVAL